MVTTPPPDRARLLLGPARATIAAGRSDPYAGRGGPAAWRATSGARSGAVLALAQPCVFDNAVATRLRSEYRRLESRGVIDDEGLHGC
jgi:hypothetical protein